MDKLVFLGTASAVAFEGHENSYLVLKGEQSSILVDCAANPILRLHKAGIHFNDVNDLVITHFHADHVSGLPNLLMAMWILGRKNEFRIYGSQHTISRVDKMMALFDWDEWQNLYPISLHMLPEEELVPVLETPDFKIQSSPGDHLIPTLGLRIETKKDNFVAVYSSDTNPDPRMVRLARNADILIHEATGSVEGHTSPGQAGEIAAQAEVGALYLIHYSLYGEKNAESIVAEAKKTFPGDVFLAEDFMEIEMNK
jgi:ribonuclease Z